MVVIRKNGKMAVYFKSANKQDNNNQVLSSKQFDDETEFNNSKFRSWQILLVRDSQVRARRNGESNIEYEEQKRIREMMNTQQKN
jgi:hypothetical protein